MEAASRSALEGFDGAVESEAGEAAAAVAGAEGVAAEAVEGEGEGADGPGVAGGGFDDAHAVRAKIQSPRMLGEGGAFMAGTL